MTTTRYISSTSFTEIHSDNWASFIDGLKNSCKFTLKDREYKNNDAKKFPICKFTARYYINNGMVYCHITNDTRRHLVKILGIIPK
jgi:hypothetical protein